MEENRKAERWYMFGHKLQKVNEFIYLGLRSMTEEQRKCKRESHTKTLKSKQ